MKIVINIPEEIYSYVNTQWKDIPKNDSPISIMCNAIIDGTPLPKEHGRLIDADVLMEYCQNDINKTVDCNDIARFPTIIGGEK